VEEARANYVEANLSRLLRQDLGRLRPHIPSALAKINPPLLSKNDPRVS
jgi:hypothetical protein